MTTEMKKKILYVITKSNWGGAQKYVFELASALKNRHDVAVAFGGTGERNAAPGLLAQKLGAAGIRTIHIPSLERNISWFKELKVLFDLVSLFRAEKPDIVHLNSSKVGGTGALAARLARVSKIIFTLHGFPLAEDRPWYQKIAIAIATWMTIFLSHETIVITKRELDTFSRWPFIKSRLTLIYNGIDPNFKIEPNSDIRASFPRGSILVGTIGELHKNKNQLAIIGAAKVTPENICYAIVGEGEERKRLEAEIARLNLEHRVKLFGFISASRALPNFDIFVLPSLKEGLPYVIFEAGLASVPVVASNVGGIPEILSDKNFGILVEPKNSTELAQAINTLAQEPLKRKLLSQMLGEKIRRIFSLEKMLSDTMKIS